jgi:transcriptional regulator with XRE-family HTH domain
VNADLLREARKAKGIPRDVLARRIGVAPSTYTRYERGEREPRAAELALLAAELDLTLDELVGTPTKEATR